MKIKETIMMKKAMLQIVEETLNCMESNKNWTERQLAEAKKNFNDYKEAHSDEENVDSTLQYYQNYQRDIDNYAAQLNAYDTIAKALEKLI